MRKGSRTRALAYEYIPLRVLRVEGRCHEFSGPDKHQLLIRDFTCLYIWFLIQQTTRSCPSNPQVRDTFALGKTRKIEDVALKCKNHQMYAECTKVTLFSSRDYLDRSEPRRRPKQRLAGGWDPWPCFRRFCRRPDDLGGTIWKRLQLAA